MKQLDKHYKKSRRMAYKEIEDYFLKHNFAHSLYSGYTSNDYYSDAEIIDLINELLDSKPWVEPSLRVAHSTVVNEIIDILKMRKDKDYLISNNERNSLDNYFNEEPLYVSIDDRIKELNLKKELYSKKIKEIDKHLDELSR